MKRKTGLRCNDCQNFRGSGISDHGAGIKKLNDDAIGITTWGLQT